MIGLLLYIELANALPPLKDLTSLWFLTRVYIQGSSIMGIYLVCLYSGQVEKVMRSLDFGGPLYTAAYSFDTDHSPDAVSRRKYLRMIRWVEHVRVTLAQPFTALETGVWDLEVLRVQILWLKIVWPMFKALFVHALPLAGLVAGLVALACAVTDKFSFLPSVVKGIGMIPCAVRL